MYPVSKILHVNWLKTILFNFKVLQFRQAIKLPVFLFGKVHTAGTKRGNIEIRCPVKSGMVRIGYVSVAWFPATNISTYKILGKHIINGDLAIGAGSKIVIENGGILETGKKVWCNENTRLHCCEHIVLKDNCLLAWDVQIIDSDFHYLLHDNMIRKNTSPVVLENGVWIGNKVSINKGAHITEMSVVASNSVVNKSYVNEGSKLLLGGIPSRILSADFQRVMMCEGGVTDLDGK